MSLVKEPGKPPRHDRLDDLLAASEDPRPRRTRRIEWIGEQSVFDAYPDLPHKLAMDAGKAANDPTRFFTPQQETAIRRAAQKAVVRVHRVRLMEHDHQHALATNKLNRTYEFRRENNYICDVDYADVDRILGSPSGHEFRDLDATEPDQPKILTPPASIVRVISTERAAATALRGDGPQRGQLIAAH